MIISPLRSLCLIGLVVLGGSLSAADRPSQPGLISSEFIYETAPFPSCHASTLVETPERELVASWFGGTHEKHPDVGIWVSRREGQRWTTPVEVANGVQANGTRHPCWNPVLFQPKQGPLLLFYKVGPDPKTWWGMLRTSMDQGRTWSEARRLPEGILGPIKNKPVQLANGDILCPTSIEYDNGPKRVDWRVYFERTTDLGVSWSKVTPPVKADESELNAIQPSILFHEKNTLQALGRTRGGRVFETWSKDGGKSWTALSYGTLPNPNSGTDAVTLKNGSHLIVYNHTPKGRSPLNLAISKDGKNWKPVLVLEDSPGLEFSYPAIIQTADGLVHLSYTWHRERIRHVVVNPAKLVAR
ncbi:MAG: exo-alpha-sialidase [Verrucomicrobiales bacterium]|nr:exo-alpha-sialidase [Verrucomicrobiales bacterium]